MEDNILDYFKQGFFVLKRTEILKVQIWSFFSSFLQSQHFVSLFTLENDFKVQNKNFEDFFPAPLSFFAFLLAARAFYIFCPSGLEIRENAAIRCGRETVFVRARIFGKFVLAFDTLDRRHIEERHTCGTSTKNILKTSF